MYSTDKVVYKLDKKTHKISYRFGESLMRFRDELFNAVREKIGYNVTDSAIVRAAYSVIKDDLTIKDMFLEKVSGHLKKGLPED